MHKNYEIIKSPEEIDLFRQEWETMLYVSGMGVFKGDDLPFVCESESTENGKQVFKGNIFIPDGYLVQNLPVNMFVGDIDEEERLLSYLLYSCQDSNGQRNADNISVKSGIEQSTGLTVSFDGPMYRVHSIPNTNKEGFAVPTILEIHNPIEVVIPKGATFNIGRLFYGNKYATLEGDSLNVLSHGDALFNPDDFDPLTRDTKRISFIYDFFTSAGSYYKEVNKDELNGRARAIQPPLWDEIPPKIFYQDDPIRYPIGIAVPYTKRYIMTANHINLPYISSLTRHQRNLLDEHLALVEVPIDDKNALSGRYSLVQTDNFRVPRGYTALVVQVSQDFFVGDMSLSNYPIPDMSFHLPSVVIDSGWSGPIRGETIKNEYFQYGNWMFLKFYCEFFNHTKKPPEGLNGDIIRRAVW
jgi:hypothetical protein